MEKKSDNIVAIIPAAGKARRLAALPYSKELYPVVTHDDDDDEGEVSVISQFLINSLLKAGIRNINFVIRPEKTDIIKHYKGGNHLNSNIAYHIADYEYGVPFSINQVYPFVKSFEVAFGFPDIYIKPLNLFDRLIENFKQNKNTDVLLGLIPIDDYLNWDMIELNEGNYITKIHLHDEGGKGLKYGWGLALWRPSFSNYLNQVIKDKINSTSQAELESNEFSIGSIFQSAIEDGLIVKGITFNDAICIDIGTFEGIEKLSNQLRKKTTTKSNS